VYCRNVAAEFWDLERVRSDPPARAFDRVGLAAAPRVRLPLSLLCPRGCAGVSTAAAAYARATAFSQQVTAAMALASDRYGGARRARSRAGMLLQAGVARAYAGELPAALAGLQSRGAALAAALARAGHVTALSGSQLNAVRAALKRGLPRGLPAQLRKLGISPTIFRRGLIDALDHAPPSLTFSQLLAAAAPTAAYRAANHEITVDQVRAIFQALAKQHAITNKTRDKLLADLLAAQRARDAVLRARALTKLQSDIASQTHGAARTLLHQAWAGLSQT
jgi:hypothetical protein